MGFASPASFSSPPASACRLGTAGSVGPDRIALRTYDAANELTQLTLGYLSPNQIRYETLTYTGDGLVQTVADGNNKLTTASLGIAADSGPGAVVAVPTAGVSDVVSEVAGLVSIGANGLGGHWGNVAVGVVGELTGVGTDS
ncbi:MAG: hypothetical protein ACRED9_03005 [Caulobacteraceae bacterium]